MSKDQEYQNDRIPSYEESIAITSSQSTQKPPLHQSIQQRTRLKRARLVNDLTTVYIVPAISRNLENGLTSAITLIIPSDAFAKNVAVNETNITSPALQSNTTLVRLQGDDYSSSFLHQPAVVQELASSITASLVDPTLLQAAAASPPSSPPSPLPARPQPQQRSSLRYMLGIIDDKDPTGSTGSWNLGWRTEEDSSSTSTIVTTDELMVVTRLQDVTFRIENMMGLLESKSVKSMWCEVALKA